MLQWHNFDEPVAAAQERDLCAEVAVQRVHEQLYPVALRYDQR